MSTYADIQHQHQLDILAAAQAFMQTTKPCTGCEGRGRVQITKFAAGQKPALSWTDCGHCAGSGRTKGEPT